MVFRDEREALRARAERAEQKLAEAERDLARARAAAEEPLLVAPALPSAALRRWGRRVAIVGALGAGIGGVLFSLSASMDRTATASWRAVGAPLYEGNTPSGSGAAFAAFERKGKVGLTTRADQVHHGAPCVVRVEPTLGRRHNCRVVVRCDDQTIYGAKGNGYTDCEMVQGAPMRAHDKEGTAAEGDPILKMDLATGQVEVSDDLPGAAAVTIELDPGGRPSEPSPR